MKRRNVFLTLALVIIILVSVFVTFQTFAPKGETVASPFYVGIEFGYGNASDCKLLIDKVKTYTNLLVISSTNITQNEALLNDTCDYAYNAGMHIVVYFPQSGNSYIWAMKAADKYGPYFLGSYIYDETGGEVLDRASGAVNINYVSYSGSSYPAATDYKSATNNFVANAGNQMEDYLYCAAKSGTSVMTADYGLYWFDYKAGYDTVFAEFGWGNNRQMAIALCRGAATAQNKDWGAIICWEAHVPGVGQMEDGPSLYNDLTLAYTNGAKYAVVFDYAGKDDATNRDLANPYEYGILTDEHFEALQNFWNYIQQNPKAHGSINPTIALVLPQYYGFGFRSVDDKIWGMDQADNWTTKMWNDASSLLREHGGNLDIVYSDPEFQLAVSKAYTNVFPWTSGATTNDYPVIDLNSTLGYLSIQKALSSGATVSGDTMLVKAGTYHENVVVNKPVVLLGENKETTVIDASNKGSALVIGCANVTVKGFTMENGNAPTTQISGLNSSEALTQVLVQIGVDPNQYTGLDPVSAQSLVLQLTQGIAQTSSLGSGIFLSYADNCTLSDNLVTNSTYGIVLASSANATLRGNTLIGNKYGFGVGTSSATTGAVFAISPQYSQDIDSSNTVNGKPIYYWTNKNGVVVPSDAGYVALVNCSGITVQGLQLANNYNGLVIVDTEGSTIINNTLTGNYEGLSVSTSSGNTFHNNNIYDNGCNLAQATVSADIDSSNMLNGKPAYVWVNQHDQTVPEDAGYVALVNCSGITVNDLNLTSNAVGILLQNTSNCTISNNTIANMTSGITLTDTASINITNNTITTCEDGIVENASTSNTIFGNVFNENVKSGITLQSSTDNNVVDNWITGSNNGISLLDSSENTLKGNDLTKNTYGIEFSANAFQYYNGQPEASTCANNTVTENNFTQNANGVSINYNVANNTFYRNNFVNNIQQAYASSYNFYSSTPTNIWDNGKEGNYWSNYNGTDTNYDGVGDQSMDVFQQFQQYVTNGVVSQQMLVSSDQDHYPLMQQYFASVSIP